ncbi:hypothetical protein GDO86_007823 [Hymenochirus boettgeri]|uniref:Iodothyronine deiodinase n=1 Tax=Hymenochirus boettgeri TaxID=247094 RepID=A0A8T2IZG8_9PIPI|nr:hypothetical protein GDO86_007823 [Hymenochirus boettgeri]
MERLFQILRMTNRCTQKVFILFFIFLYVAVGKVFMFLFPQTMASVLKSRFEITGVHDPKFQYEDWGPTLFTYKFLRSVLQIMWLRMEDEAFVGHTAPNTPVVDMNGEMHHIWDYLKGKQNLQNMSWFNKLVHDFRIVADFLIIYIDEAHAADGWALKNNLDIKKHQSLQDRLVAAKRLLEELPSCPVVLDTMKNLCSAKYAALPERLYILKEGKIMYKGKMGPWGYKPEEVRSVLEKNN